MGGIRHALEEARAVAGLPDDTTIVEYPPQETSLLDTAMRLAGIARAQAFTIDGLPVQIKAIARGIAPMMIYSGETPLARMEYVPLDSGETTEP
jgi:hypothetical protein